ncbi:Energy-coupling factor transporter transmembrane protein EcfT [Slackia heliotrinireducens]|uniref:ABC-type cobalt transport system, permease component CbiQ n=1 Tax=Slackia heliotrinireducens (strain ATCC 29202 / DSM 20476 / NCTC 11029 / RHS 1) TaxID=471855 RepID=C7N0R9_SLAHD|nr:energy-coupling factor transporter transmembrane component T [Slackia heliotrinireducens]ACV21147.1 ABC-type cobalt transport system, permease component CbiQ [Slackia heliotrinireducens DSM 20476]VEH03844.1 Energy-coupling factor transporter transmembrane protein EcfT [Slackia heliotrinireducens]
MEFNLYGDDSKALVRIDPRTKMFVFLISSILSIHTYSSMATLIMYDTALCILLAVCGKKGTALKAFAAFAVAAYLRICIAAQPGGFGVATTVCQALVTFFLFAFPVLISLVLIIQTTRISQFLAAFQAMHLPAGAIIPVAVMLRFIPTVQDEWSGIRKAMAFRGIDLDFASVARHPMQSIEYLLVPLLISSVSVMEELAAAALARGLEAEHTRTSYEEVRLSAADYVVLVVFGIMAAIILFVVFSGVSIL